MENATNKLLKYLIYGQHTISNAYIFKDATITFKVVRQKGGNSFIQNTYPLKSIYYDVFDKEFSHKDTSKIAFDYNGKYFVVWVEYEGIFGLNAVNLINYEGFAEEILGQIKELVQSL